MENTKKRATLELTNGPVLPLMLKFCLPILLGNIMEQFYNMVDSAIVGQFIGINALGAVGATGSLTFMIIGFINGMCAGFCIPVAQAFGSCNKSLLRRCVVNIIYLSVFCMAVITLVTNLLLGKILVMMNFPAEIIDDSLVYMRVILLGIPATIAYNTQAGLMRSMGNSKTPLLVLAFASVSNVVLDLLCVCVFKWGVMGAALATVAAQLMSAVVCFIYIIKSYPELRAEKNERKIDRKIVMRLTLSGLPMALQYSITAIGSLMIQTAINGFGSLSVAAITAGNKVQDFVQLPFNTLGITMSTWCGQNMGAWKYKRIKRGFFTGMIIAIAYSVVIGAVLFFAGEYISMIFISKDTENLAELLELVRTYIRFNCLFYVSLGVLTVCRFSLQGLEQGFVAMFAGVFEMLARASVALFLVDYMGYKAICIASPIAWLSACVLLVPACLVVFPKIKKKLS